MTDETNGADAPNQPSPEYQAFLDDLKAYDNPEVFQDASLPQYYKLRIVNKTLSGLPTIFDIEVNGEVLPYALREAFFSLLKLDPDAERRMREDYGDKDLSETRSRMDTDEEYLEAEDGMRRFFVRNFPKLMLRLYEIIMMMSVLSSLRQILDQPDEISAREKTSRTVLKGMLRALEKDIKQMLEARSSGRPKKYGTGRLPEIVKRVIYTARGMMGDATGKDAVPVLKGVAFNLDLTENALRKQLVRAGHPWAGIRDWLASQP